MTIPQSNIIFSLDIGTRSIIGTIGSIKNNKLIVIAEEYLEHDERAMIDGQIHDIDIIAKEVIQTKHNLEKKINSELKNVCIAAAGRFLKTTIVKSQINVDYNVQINNDIVRSLEMTAVKKAESEVSKQTKGKLYCVGYSVVNYYLNGYVISNLLSHNAENIGVEVIATFLPRSVVDSLYCVTEKANLNVINLTLEPIAALEAVVPKEYRLLNIGLIDIGAGTSDIAICNSDTISAYGMVPLAGDEVTEYIAKNLLVDFNSAEKIKKQINTDEIIEYNDVLGFKNKISNEEMIKLINPVVKKIAIEVSKKMIELNGGKSPGAVFLVGGGSYTPNLKTFLCEGLNLPENRVALKDREDVKDCLCNDNSLKSIGVTVLGIALVAMKKSGNNFVDITINDRIISLFNTGKHTVKDVLFQAGINPRLLIGKNGKNKRFTINGVTKIAFGTLASNSIIRINGIEGNIDSQVKANDIINIKYAKDGNNANPKIYEYIKSINSVTFYINDMIHTVEPIVFLNGKQVKIDSFINDGDNIKIENIKTLGQYKKHFENEKFNYFIDGYELNDDYIINEGDKIYKKQIDEYIDNKVESETIINTDINDDKDDNINLANSYNKIEKFKSIKVNVNGNEILMNDKKRYVFVDVFNYIKFDLSKSKGKLILLLNNKKAGYYDELSDNDYIVIKWQ